MARRRFATIAWIPIAFAIALLLCAGCARFAPVRQATEFETATITRIVDGDTLLAECGGAEEYVRLQSIDAPESVNPDESLNIPEGGLASDYLKSIVRPGDAVYLQVDKTDRDKYGRLLRYVWLEAPSDAFDDKEISSKMLNAIIVRDGYARAKRYDPDVLYAAVLETLQADAVAHGLGVSYLWSE